MRKWEGRRGTLASRTGSVLTTWRYWSAAALVKNRDPTKYVTLSVVVPTQLAYPGSAPSAKHAEPTMNRTPIHPWRPMARHTVGAIRSWTSSVSVTASRLPQTQLGRIIQIG